ncbi:hypothetical protein SORBI_3008G121501 [Sorghum bicolor]|uniref:Uncharacterized protein n=1 Tax=Sorghum bicolor TaxID=4558 RepID=A0A1Z5R688_SORBI|nr:hypothetical protein SORBI_3008G121501 [Sorghum bicolor]
MAAPWLSLSLRPCHYAASWLRATALHSGVCPCYHRCAPSLRPRELNCHDPKATHFGTFVENLNRKSLSLSLDIPHSAALPTLLPNTPPHPTANLPCSSPTGHHLRIRRPPRRSLPLGAPPLLSGALLSQPGVQICWSEHNRWPSMCDPKACHHPCKHGPKSAVTGRVPPPCLLCLDTWASGSTATSTHKNRYASKWQHCSQALRHEQNPEDRVAALLSRAHCLYVVEGLQIYWLVVARSS